jgi:hypothetical protein
MEIVETELLILIDGSGKNFGGKSTLRAKHSGINKIPVNYMWILFMKLYLEPLCINIYMNKHFSVFQ